MESIIDDLAITCDEIIESYNDETNNLNFTCIFNNYYSIIDSC